MAEARKRESPKGPSVTVARKRLERAGYRVRKGRKQPLPEPVPVPGLAEAFREARGK